MKTEMGGAISFFGAVVVLVSGCVTHIQPYEKRVRVYEEDHYEPGHQQYGDGSLWKNTTVGLFEDDRARYVGDIITIIVDETAIAARDAATKTKSESSNQYGVTSFFNALEKIKNANPDLTMSELFSASHSSEFGGKGSTSRSGSLQATVPARIKRVMPNGDYYIEGSKVMLVNHEESFLYVSGVIRALDISGLNTVDSFMIADVELEYTGRGVIADRQSPGWLSRVMQWIWPF
ncbi:MAG: flagellar basal body L-ring protein FlgH [Myxococcota bacterium]|nr:flagellar basal body L-ring protein FlgH [Myxococcota bacterium]